MQAHARLRDTPVPDAACGPVACLGAQRDVESYIYLPLLEETGYIPNEKYAFPSEILEQAQRIGKHDDLYPRSFFQTRVKEQRWDDTAARWAVTTVIQCIPHLGKAAQHLYMFQRTPSSIDLRRNSPRVGGSRRSPAGRTNATRTLPSCRSACR